MVNHNYRLLVIDIDGTLLGAAGTISAEDREALARAESSGVQVALSTGRAAMACRGIIDELALDGHHIFFEGALVSSLKDDGEIYIRPIPAAVAERMVAAAHRQQIDLELYSAMGYFAERESWSTEAHRHYFDIAPTIVDFTGLWEQEKIIKGMVVATNEAEASRIRQFCRHFDGSLRLSWVRTPAYPGVDFINLVAPGASKGEALQALVSHLGIAMTEVMAIGDGNNDVSMFSPVGLAVAMGNAPDEVKAVADHVTLDTDHSGVAAAIEKFLL
ncbi:MAG: HAD family phosphatase [Chloroflexi bacterium]|nr:HAD family phosphatase [Chloroflexota bacterium]